MQKKFELSQAFSVCLSQTGMHSRHVLDIEQMVDDDSSARAGKAQRAQAAFPDD